jgi:hypothetical protein
VFEFETIRTASRLAANEGCDVVIVGLAVDVDSRKCIHLDRNDAIVPLASGHTWAAHRDSIVQVTGHLRRHAEANDPVTGLSSLEIIAETISVEPPRHDGVIRTALELRRAEGEQRTLEGMAYRSSNGNILVLAGCMVYVREMEQWPKDVVTTTVSVSGTVRHGGLPPEAPSGGGSWYLDHPILVPSPPKPD